MGTKKHPGRDEERLLRLSVGPWSCCASTCCPRRVAAGPDPRGRETSSLPESHVAPPSSPRGCAKEYPYEGFLSLLTSHGGVRLDDKVGISSPDAQLGWIHGFHRFPPGPSFPQEAFEYPPGSSPGQGLRAAVAALTGCSQLFPSGFLS